MRTEMNKTDLAYAAGFMDGEGTITIRHERRGPARSDVHVLQITIGMTDRRPLDWMKETFGGGVRGPLKRQVAHHKPIYFWQLSAAKAGEFLHLIRPYMKVKGEQADVALRLRDIAGRQGVLATTEVMDERHRLKQELAALNHRGV